MGTDRSGRGRLSSLDLLPDEAQDDLLWAMSELNQRKRSQADILFELNDRLEVKGIAPISRAAFNRKSTTLAARAMQMEERRHVYAGFAERLTPEEVGKNDLVLGEFLKLLIDHLSLGEALDSKNAMELARAYKDTIVAQRHSAEHQKKAEEKANEKLSKVMDAAEAIAKQDGKPFDKLGALMLIREAHGI